TEDPKVREEGERQTRLAVSPQLVWLSPEDKNRLLHESNPNKDDVEKQTNALRLCAQKWVQEKEFGYAGGVVNRAKLVVFNREDGTVLVGLELVDPRGVGDYAPGNLVFALNVEQSVEKEILIPISYQEADALPTERRPEPTFVTVNVDGLLGTDLEGNPITADGLALEDGTFVAYRKEMKIGRINPRHIGKRAGSDQSETYPGWELTKQGRTAYVEQNPSGLTEEQRRQWKLFYEDIEPETAELKKQGAVINFDFQSSIFPSVVEGENGQAMAVWSSKKGTWLEAKILPVKTDKQDKSLSCESSAAGMIAQYFNPNPPKDYSTWEEYIMSIPLNCNPDKGYRGAINGGLSTSCDAAAGLGYGVHAEPVAKILQKAGLDAEAVYSVDFNWLKEQIDNGSLAVVWVSGKTDPLVEWHQDDDESKYYTILGEHAITVVGYFVDRHQEGEKTVEKTFFVTNDPTSGTQYPVAGFYNWGLFNNMTLVVRGLNNRREPKFES
ncbi:MAG: C39 family peptidase, partial [Patescibacteria group bacterium]